MYFSFSMYFQEIPEAFLQAAISFWSSRLYETFFTIFRISNSAVAVNSAYWKKKKKKGIHLRIRGGEH